MNFISSQVTFQEIPTEISLSYLIAGCPLRCSGCHSADSWNPIKGLGLTEDILKRDLKRNAAVITCVLFLGGEWEQDELKKWLQLIRDEYHLKTALYTGAEDIPEELKKHLDYLKTGPYRKELGGLSSPSTNQKLIDLSTGENLNHLFQIQGGSDDQIERHPVKTEN